MAWALPRVLYASHVNWELSLGVALAMVNVAVLATREEPRYQR